MTLQDSFVYCLRFSLYSALTSLRFFFFNDTATTEIYTLSLHDALPIWVGSIDFAIVQEVVVAERGVGVELETQRDRKSTRLNSSHGYISYAVFCLKKKKTKKTPRCT